MGKIIAICGSPGAGKSSLVRELTDRLDCLSIDMDEHSDFTSMSIEELAAWNEGGGDYDIFDMPELEKLLANACEKSSVTLFESHFGRANKGTGQYIDMMFWLDLPAETALARQTREMINDMLSSDEIHREQLQWLNVFLVNYETVLAPVMAKQRRDLTEQADFILDASLSAQELADIVLAKVDGHIS